MNVVTKAPDQPLIIHHARAGGDTFSTRVISDGVIDLDPPGVQLSLVDIYDFESPAA